MTPVVQIVRFSFGLVLVWAIFYLSIRPLLLDILRHRLFAIRDGLFDFAADGGIDFDDINYRELRNDINDLILFAHRISFTRLLLSRWTKEEYGDDTHAAIQQWFSRVDQLPNLQRRKLLEARSTALHQVVAYMFNRSPALYVVTTVLKIIGLWAGGLRALFQNMPKIVEPLEVQARAERRFA